MEVVSFALRNRFMNLLKILSVRFIPFSVVQLHLGPKMSRPNAPEAEKVMGRRDDVKKLEDIKQEMRDLSRKIKAQDIVVLEKLDEEPPKPAGKPAITKKQEVSQTLEQTRSADPDELASSSGNTTYSEVTKVKVSELLNVARDYAGNLEEQDRTRGAALSELGRQKKELLQPYRKEAVGRYVTGKYKPEWETLNERVAAFNDRLKIHEEAGLLTKIGWDLGKSYNKAADELEKKGEKLKDDQTTLKQYEVRDRQELSDPRNIYARGKQEVDRLADKLPQERDPDYPRKKADIERTEERIITAQRSSQPERNRIQELCRNLEKLDQQKEWPLTLDRAGKSKTLEQIVKNPNIVDMMNQKFKEHHKARDRAMER